MISYDPFHPLGPHRTRLVTLVRLHMRTNDECWELYSFDYLNDFLYIRLVSFFILAILLVDIPHCDSKSSASNGETL